MDDHAPAPGRGVVLPGTPAAQAALAVAERFCSPALLNHCLRSYRWAVELAAVEGRPYDDELLFVAALLHDLGLVDPFDSHVVPFEEAGGEVAWVLAAGAGWVPERRDRLAEVIVRHMRGVAAETDVEGHLLAAATAIDITARGIERIDPVVLAEVAATHPRLALAEVFAVVMEGQAARKPGCAAAAFVDGGGLDQLRSHPLDRSG